MDMEYAAVQAELSFLLRDRPRGTVAQINDHTIAYLSGHEVRGLYLAGNNDVQLAREFDFDERACNHLHADLVAWLAAPRYAVRDELEEWLAGTPPFGAG
jgi:hypothetical protein